MNLGATYTQKMWERCKVPHNKQFIGKQYLSWSRIETFNDKAGFNTGLLGEYEYMLNKFSKIEFVDQFWGQYGSELEAYITLRNKKDLSDIEEKVQKEFNDALINFSDRERAILDTIQPLGVFQDEICYYVEELDIIVLGYVDDRTLEVDGVIELMRDYKSKSESSKKDLHLPKKHQLEIYILGYRQRGLDVKKAEYCISERLGGYECMQGGGRESLSVGDRIWYESYNWSEERLKETHQLIIETAKKIESLYKTYQKYFGGS